MNILNLKSNNMDYHLSILFGKHDISKLPTPSYIFFPYLLKQNAKLFKKLSENGIDVFYALKANNYRPLVQTLISEGFGFDIASKQELEYVLSLGADPNQIIFSAPSKLTEDIVFANQVGIKFFAFDSETEARKIMENAPSAVLIARITAYNKEAIFNLSDKFGMSKQYFLRILRLAKKEKWSLEGITFHVGSQNTSSASWIKAIEASEHLIHEAHKKGIDIKYLDIGGGIPAPYEKHIPSIGFYIDKIIQHVSNLKKRLPDLKVFVEPGRSMCADSFVLCTRVIDIKTYKSPPTIIVDTGTFNGMIEPLEGFEYPIYLEHFGDCEKKYYKIGGFSCEGYDILKKRTLLPRNIKLGDLIVFMYAGAYTFVYKNFHMVPYPSIVKESKIVT